MKVIAAAGTKCPMEGNPRKYITDVASADVADSAYYKRLVEDGSLLIAPANKPARKKETKANGI